MSDTGRRQFLKTLAMGAAYAAPVVLSVAAPPEMLGQGMGPTKKCGTKDLPPCPTEVSAPASATQTSPPIGAPPPGGPPPGAPPPGRDR